MFEYTDASGQIYTEDQINKMAAEQKTSASAIIKSKGLKRKSSTTSTAPKQTKKTYPWGNQEEKKQEPGFLSNFKKSVQKPKAVKPTAPMTPVESQAFLDELTTSVYQQQFPQPFSMETEAFKKQQAKKAEEKKVVEEADFRLFQKQAAELDLKKDREASKWVEDGIIASKIAEEELAEIDLYIDSEKKKLGQKVIIPGRISRDGIQTTPERTEIYQPFATEVAKIKKDLIAKKLLNEFDDKTILEMAAADYRKNEIAKRKEDKFMDYLENTTDISDKSRKLADNYFEKAKAAEASSYVKDVMIRDEKENQISGITKKIDELSKSIKPKGYKFQTQEEIDAENKKISQRNELIELHELEKINYKNLNKKIDKTSANYDDVNFQQDLYKRDYSWTGQADKLKTRSVQWAYEMLGAVNYLSAGPIMDSAYDYLKIEELTGIKNPFSAHSNFLADRVDALSTDLQELYPKQRELTSVEGIYEKAGDLLINQAPDLIVMALTGGSSAAAKTLQTAAKPSLLKKAGSYLALNKQTSLIAARGVGSKYLDMISQEKNGYYDENGEFIKPNYSLTELIVAPAVYGYAEGVFERSTGKILEKGKGFFKAASNAQPDKWFDFNVQTTNKLIKKAGGNFIEAQVEEQLSEQLTNVVQNGVDKFILGKDVNLLANAGEVGQDTVLLTTLLAGAPILGGAAIRPFMSESNASKAFNNSRSMAAILHELQFNKDLSEIQKTALQKKLGELKDKTSDIFSSTVNNMADMSPKAFNIINDTATEIATIMSKAKEIDASDSVTKDADLAELKNDFIKAKVKLDRLAVATESVKTFDKPISVIAKANLIDLATQRVEVGFNDTLSEEEKKSVYDSIETETEKIYKSEGVDLKEARIKEFEQNLKAAQKIAKNTNTEIILVNETKNIEKTINSLVKSGVIGAASKADISTSKGSDGTFLQGVDGKDYIIINREVALKTKAVSVASHEFLHKLLAKTFSNLDSQIALGESLTDYLLSNNPELYLDQNVIDRLENNYGNYDEGTKMEELLTIFSDALITGNIKYKESVFTKIGDQIRRYLQDIGLASIEFNSGRDVFNFIRDYNNTIAKGKELSKAQKRLLEKGAEGELVSKSGKSSAQGFKQSKSIEERMDALDEQLNDGEIDYDTYERKMIALEKEEAELKRKEYEEQKAGLGKEPEVKKAEKKEAKPKEPKSKEDIEISEVAAKAKAKLDAIGNDPKGFDPGNPTIYNELDKMVKVKSRNWRTNKGTVIDFTNKDKGGLDGFDMDEMTSYVRTSMIPYIAKFDPSRNNSLYGYINAQYINRMRAALKSGEVANVVFTEDVTEMTKLANEDVEVTKPSLPERKRFQNILESGVFSPDVIENIQAKILPVVRTLKSKINEKTSLNKTVVPLIAEIRDEMGKQADIDIKKAMGGKENQELQNWLIVNKKTILENMTTTWLMGKDQGDKVLGGMPFAIQKRVNGRWLNYPEWVGKKIDRESVDVDLAGRTAGHEMVRRLPEVNKNVSTTEFLSSIIDLETGNVLRGRKEALAKVLAEEVSFDIISDDIANDGIIAQALNRNQELKGAITERIIVEEFNRLAERGNIKFSLTEKELIDGISYLIEKSSFNAAMIERKGEYNPFKALYNKLITNGFTEDELEELFTKYNDALDKIGHYKHEKFIGGIIKSRLSKNYIYKLFGGNNSYNPDVLISEGKSLKNIKTDNALKAIVEIKKDIFARMTSATLNVVRTKYSGTDWGKKIIEEYDNFKKTDLFKQIGNYLADKSENEGYKIKDIEGLESLLKGKKTIFKIDLSIDSVKDINNNKAFSNDLLVIGTSLTDYFGADFLKKYEITDTDIITAQVELKIEKKGYLRPRVYFYVNKKVAKDIDKIASKLSLKDVNNKVNAVIKRKKGSMYSKSLENNLNFFNKDNKGITIVSDYIAANNIRRIDAETSFDVLNDLKKSIEDWWGIVENKTIDGMASSVDYAFDVIEDRENEGGPLMAAVNNALNLETIKFAERQLNEWINNDTKWKARSKFSKSAWHGSVYDFKKFSLDNYGKGDGQKTFAWGAFFTDVESIAKKYSNYIFGLKLDEKGNALNEYNFTFENDKYKWTYDEKIDDVYYTKNNKRISDEEGEATLSKLKKQLAPEYSEILYNVELFKNKKDIDSFAGKLIKAFNADMQTYKLLDWEKQINDKKLLNNLNLDSEKFNNLTTKQLYEKLEKREGSKKAASLLLLENGIDGIKYAVELDTNWGEEYNQSKFKKKYNYVIFDENEINIKSKVKFSLTTKANLKWETKLGQTSAKFKVGDYNYSIYMSSLKKEGLDQDPRYTKTFKKVTDDLGVPLTYLTDNENLPWVTFEEDYGGTSILETGNSFKVLSIVTNGLVEYIQENNIEGIVFTAEEPSRIRLYKTIAATIGSRLGWTYNTEQISGEEGTLFLVNTPKDNKTQNQLKINDSKSLDYEFNDMLERNKAIPSYEKFSDIVAKRKGEKVRSLSFFVPPSADDFRGLTTYMFAGKGKQGELDQQFFDQNLVIPYVKGINALDSVRQSIKREYKALLSEFPDIKSKLEKLTPDKQFTYDQAIRVYLWNKNNIEIPGLNRRDKNKLVYLVKTDSNLLSFAEALSIAGRQDGGWMEPSVTWDSETIISDLHNITEGDGRKQWLAEFIENANAIFSTENLNKIQAIYGTNVRIALEDALYRMKNGKNRPEGTDALTNRWMNWINGSTAAIMFFNIRSAILQTISSINYLNWNDNNPLMAAKAFANQKQYWTDFAMIINSDKMRERRAGLKADVTQAEIANAANSAKNKARGILSYLQKIGFTPTQAADSFSIAIGGAAFYRNRVNTYLKQADEDGNLINTKKEAEDKAWLDFSMISDQSMQSADPLYISKQQTTSLGRLVLAFANTPLQYNRLIKKATLDLVNKRGDWKTNMSKILYYGALQNFIFSALQSALFLPFEDEEEEVLAKMSEEQRAEYDKLKKKQEDKTINILNGMADTVLRGSGITGALISTIKNAVMEYNKQEQREMFADHAYTILAVAGISPPISSKARKLYGVHRIKKFEKDVIEERGWEITKDGRLNLSPNYSIVGNIAVATTNVPLDRLVEKIDNVSEALDSRNTKLQRVALMLGWKEWELNVKNEENELIKAAAKVKRKEEGIIKSIETKAKKKKEREEALDKMTPEEREIFYAKEAEIKSKKGSAKDKILDAMTPEERGIYYETGVFPKKKKRKMGGD